MENKTKVPIKRASEPSEVLMDLKPNLKWDDSDIIFGDVVFMSHNEDGEAVSLTDTQIEQANKFIDENVISDEIEADNADVMPFNSYKEFVSFLSEMFSIEIDRLDEGMEM